MKTKYYPIQLLQNDSGELNELVEQLLFGDWSSAEIDKVKENLKYFFCTFRSDLHLIVESNYVDSVYRDSYYNYYSTKRNNYSRYCLKISFFDTDFNYNIDFNDVDNIQKNYLGYLIVRPLLRCIGKNIIKPEAKVNYCKDIKICRVNLETSCFGVKLKAEGFPHASQDSETMTCAETTLWSLLEYYGNKYNLYKPINHSEIRRSIEPFSYERMLPSKGLTYNQISVALREFGFGPKIYLKNNYSNKNKFFELIACYIESGIPLALALTNSKLGHAVVCIGRKDVNKQDVTNYSFNTEINNKKLYNWNLAVAHGEIVFNDDNYPNYQLTTLTKPCSYYTSNEWDTMEVTQFIAPLYNKVYMEADSAIELSKSIVDMIISGGNNNIIKTFLTSCRSYREYITKSKSLSNDEKAALLQIEMPKFVWITELSTIDELNENKINTLLILDATGSKSSNIYANIILLVSEGIFYKYEYIDKVLKGYKTSFPKTFDAFKGNLK